MLELGKSFEGFRTFDVGIKNWTKKAEEVINQFGPSSVVDYPTVTPFTGEPKLTGGAYTCYAGIARSKSGLYVFHLYEEDAYNTLKRMAGEPLGGLVGGVPLKEIRKHPNEFANNKFIKLEPRHSALGGFNFMALPGNEVLYAAGYFDANDIING